MPDSSKYLPYSTSRFFDNYLICLTKAAVRKSQHQWYILYIEWFIKALNGRKIKSLNVTDINQYLDTLGRRKGLKDWQFAQHINAIRILYRDLLKLPVEQDVDWSYWLDSAKVLGNDHPTTARQLSPEELTYI